MKAGINYTAIEDGKFFESIFLRNLRYKILGTTKTHYHVSVISKQTRTAKEGFQKVVITAFTKWNEMESIDYVKRCFENGEFLLCDEENINEFKEL